MGHFVSAWQVNYYAKYFVNAASCVALSFRLCPLVASFACAINLGRELSPDYENNEYAL